jgi:4-coumarate--CoA ligase
MSLPSELDPSLPRRECPAHEEGELWCSGPQIMKGYWRNPSATAETIHEDEGGRWLKTGDIAYFDDEGKFFVTGRLKELIKVKGMQVAPAELDGVCLECEGVADAGVVGVTLYVLLLSIPSPSAVISNE